MGVVLVTRKKPFCVMCLAATRLLQNADVPYESVDITEYEGDLGGIRSIPILVIDGEPIGSIDAIREYVSKS
jgi:glutaredoxin